MSKQKLCAEEYRDNDVSYFKILTRSWTDTRKEKKIEKVKKVNINQSELITNNIDLLQKSIREMAWGKDQYKPEI